MSMIQRYHAELTDKYDDLVAANEDAGRTIDAELQLIKKRLLADKKSYERINELKEKMHLNAEKLLDVQQEIRNLSKELPSGDIADIPHPEEK